MEVGLSWLVASGFGNGFGWLSFQVFGEGCRSRSGFGEFFADAFGRDGECCAEFLSKKGECVFFYGPGYFFDGFLGSGKGFKAVFKGIDFLLAALISLGVGLSIAGAKFDTSKIGWNSL